MGDDERSCPARGLVPRRNRTRVAALGCRRFRAPPALRRSAELSRLAVAARAESGEPDDVDRRHVRCHVDSQAVSTTAFAGGVVRAAEEAIGDLLRSSAGRQFHPPRQREYSVILSREDDEGSRDANQHRNLRSFALLRMTLHLAGIRKSFGDTIAVDDVSLSVEPGKSSAWSAKTAPARSSPTAER